MQLEESLGCLEVPMLQARRLSCSCLGPCVNHPKIRWN